MEDVGQYPDMAMWLVERFRDWERQKGRRQNITAFARYLGVTQPSLSRWMTGDNVPDEVNLKKIAAKLGPEIYDALGLPRPDPLVTDLARVLDELPPDQAAELRTRLSDAIVEWLRERGLTVTFLQERPPDQPE